MSYANLTSNKKLTVQFAYITLTSSLVLHQIELRDLNIKYIFRTVDLVYANTDLQESVISGTIKWYTKRAQVKQ